MALAKKGTRKIVVREQTYRWVVSPDSDYMVLIVELLENPGQKLEVAIPYKTATGERVVIAPGLVESLITGALENGWKPQVRSLPAFKANYAKVQ